MFFFHVLLHLMRQIQAACLTDRASFVRKQDVVAVLPTKRDQYSRSCHFVSAINAVINYMCINIQNKLLLSVNIVS